MYELILKTQGIGNVSVKLYDYEQELFFQENVNDLKVYADADYEIELIESELNKDLETRKINIAECEQTDLLNYKISKEEIGLKQSIRSFNIYINENKVDAYGDAANIVLVNKKIFNDTFGFARITLELILKNGEMLRLFSNYLPIMVKDEETVTQIQNMYEYVLNNEQILLHKGVNTNEIAHETSNNENDKAISKVTIAADIARLYENNFGYFRTNSRYKIKENYVVDNVEKLRNISSKTLEYIASHPEQLGPIAGNGAVQFNGQGYIPKKTLIQENQISVDIYENQVIIGFLHTIISDLYSMKENLDGISNSIPEDIKVSNNKLNPLKEGEYIHSAQLVLFKTGKIIHDKQEKISKLLDKFQGILSMYNSVLNVTKTEVLNIPKPTPIFMSIPNYNMMFNGFRRWFAAESIALEYNSKEEAYTEESFMLSFVNLSSFYELYVLCRLINDIKAKGYSLEYSEKYSYKLKEDLFYGESEAMNTYIFSNENEEKLTLYYQPVIYKGGHKNNRTGLYRNISLSFSENGYTGEYYVPDYVIKKNVNGRNEYFILDAKYMPQNNVKYKIPELSYKYLFSLSTIDKDDEILGLYILYGKPNINNIIESAYDYEINKNEIKPVVQLVPMG